MNDSYFYCRYHRVELNEEGECDLCAEEVSAYGKARAKIEEGTASFNDMAFVRDYAQEINRRMSHFDELEGEWIDEEGNYAKEDCTK